MRASETLLFACGQRRAKFDGKAMRGGPLIPTGGFPVVRWEVSQCGFGAANRRSKDAGPAIRGF
jgi:hypothetical protein